MSPASACGPRRPLIALVGPTATGKTALAVALAQRLHGDVISADSRQIYRELTIGSAKPSEAEQGGVRHYLLDVASPLERYSAARYRDDALEALRDIDARQRLAIIAGGTGFYLNALLQDGFIPEIAPDETFRASLQDQSDDALYASLLRRDPRRAAQLHPHNRSRVVRALEIIHFSGAPTPQPTASAQTPGAVIWLGLTFDDRDAHRDVIDARIDAMLAAGWLGETEALMARYGPQAHALCATHGYPELMRVAQGEWTLPQAVASIRTQIHQYARRQRTWFRRNGEIHWIARDTMTQDEVLQAALDRLSSAAIV